MTTRVDASPAAVSFRGLTSNQSRLLTADDVAERWQVPKAQVYRLTREGRLSAVRIGRYYRYRPAVVEEFEAQGGVAADD